MVRDPGRRGQALARRRTRIVLLALALWWFSPALAYGATHAYPLPEWLLNQDIERLIIDQRRIGVFLKRKTIELILQTNALILLETGRGQCPVQIRVLNSSGHAMWNIAVRGRPRRGGVTDSAGKEIHVPFLPAHTETIVEFPCAKQGNTIVPLSFPIFAEGVTLDAGVVQTMLAQTTDFSARHRALAWSNDPQDKSVVASTLELFSFDEKGDRELFEAFSRALLDAKGAEQALTAFVDARSSVLMPAQVVAAAKEGKVSISEIVYHNSTLKKTCDKVMDLRRCADTILGLGPGAAGLLRPEFLTSVSAMLKGASSSRAAEITPKFRALGLDAAPVVASLCERAEVAGVSGITPDEGDLLEAASRIQPDAPCVASVQSRLSRRAAWNRVLGVVIRILVVGAPLALLFLYYRKRWRKVREKLAGPSASSAKQSNFGVLGGRLDPKVWHGGFGATLDALAGSLKRDESEEARAAAEAIARVLAGDAGRIVDSVRRTAVAALESGALQSFIAEIHGVLLYVLVFPGQHDGPQTLHQYPAFADGWIKHLGRLRKLSEASSGAPAPIMSLIVFLRPDASEGTALAGYDDGRLRLLPASLLDPGETRRAVGRIRSQRHEFMLEQASP
jgi:hypothetical protein